MWKLGLILFIIVGPMLAGIGALIPLTIYGVNEINPMLLLGCAVAGAVIAIPVSFILGNKISHLITPKDRLPA